MEIGINLQSAAWCPTEKQAKLMRENSFTRTFMMSDDCSATPETIDLFRNYGITFDTLHAPFRTINNIWKDDESGEKTLNELICGVKKCAELGIPTLIVHLSSGRPAPRINDIGHSRFDRLMSIAKENNIQIAFENQRYVANIADALESYPEAGMCWDVGHEGCFTPGKHFMPLFGDRLAALHIHDNNLIYNGDDHLLPFDGKIDFDYVARELARLSYGGTIMLEVFCENEPYNSLAPEDFYKKAASSAKRLIQKIYE
ncbi:MAG: sugar phosphate isomerase/epimerase [Ruminococcaceae bacterium]|nr:sugar phosphate isomerase/epimerase [Oscillospiraceae bacterium]